MSVFKYFKFTGGHKGEVVSSIYLLVNFINKSKENPMHKQTPFIIMIVLLGLYGLMSAGCVTDPIKAVKNNPDRMEIVMNHIANDDTFREKMVQKLMSTGDRQKLAQELASNEELSRNLVSKILENPKGQEDIQSRIGNRREYLTKALERGMQMPEFRETILSTLIANKDMLDFMKSSQALKDALAGTTSTGEATPTGMEGAVTAEKKQPESAKSGAAKKPAEKKPSTKPQAPK